MSAATSLSSRRSPFEVAADLFDPPVPPYADDPVGFARDILNFHAWSKQAEIMEAVRDHDRTAVRAGHGPGKTAVAGRVALWFLKTHLNSRVITTAPTWQQVEQQLWREIRAGIAGTDGTVFPPPSATKLELGDQWFAIGLSTDTPERFQGHHAKHLLLIVDEASGVDERIYEAAEGFLTAEGAKLLLLGNPTQIGGQFHRAFTVERASWRTIHISTFDTPNFTGEPISADVARSLPRPDWPAEKAADWGEDSDAYRVRVLGEFPAGATNTVIGLAQVEAAQKRDLAADPARDLIVIGVDVARFGDDETVISTRIGPQIRLTKTLQGKAVTETAGAVLREVRKYSPGAVRVVVDDPGVGGGVTDLLRETLHHQVDPIQVTAFNGGHQAFRPDDHPNRRSEIWFAAADQLGELDLDPDEQLLGDLTAPRYSLDSRGRRVVEPKAQTKKRLRRSPDRADSVLLTLVPAGAGVVTETPPSRGGRRPQDPPAALAPTHVDFFKAW